MLDNKDPNDKLKQDYLLTLMHSKDAEVLREMLLTSLSVINTLYRRVQLHLVLHPIVFLAGFLTCYFFFL